MRKVAILGCGKIGQTYVNALHGVEVDIVAVVDSDQSRRRVLSETVKSPGYSTLAEALDAEPVDLVLVATPGWSHSEMALTALGRDVDVFCEKPLTATLEEAQRLQEALNESGCRFGMGFKMRYETVFRRVYDEIRKRNLGSVVYVSGNYFQQLPDVEWYLTEGVVLNLLVHLFDLANWYIQNEPSQVIATTSRLYRGDGEDRAFTHVQYRNGSVATLACGYVAGLPDIAGSTDLLLEVICEGGTLVARRPNLLLLRDASGDEEIRLEPINAFRAELLDFLSALDGDREPPVSFAAGFLAQQMADAAFRSANAGGHPMEL